MLRDRGIHNNPETVEINLVKQSSGSLGWLSSATHGYAHTVSHSI